MDSTNPHTDAELVADRRYSEDMRNEYDPLGIPQHAAGAKLDAGKLLADMVLADFAPALEHIIRVGTHGAGKYTEGGWLKVSNGERRYANAGKRHWLDRAKGELVDPASGELHLAHEAWNKIAELVFHLRRADVKAAVGGCVGGEGKEGKEAEGPPVVADGDGAEPHARRGPKSRPKSEREARACLDFGVAGMLGSSQAVGATRPPADVSPTTHLHPQGRAPVQDMVNSDWDDPRHAWRDDKLAKTAEERSVFLAAWQQAKPGDRIHIPSCFESVQKAVLWVTDMTEQMTQIKPTTEQGKAFIDRLGEEWNLNEWATRQLEERKRAPLSTTRITHDGKEVHYVKVPPDMSITQAQAVLAKAYCKD